MTSSMTEEDTFRALVRPSFAEMRALYQHWRRDINNSRHWSEEERTEFFNAHHWNVREFSRQFKEDVENRRGD